MKPLSFSKRKAKLKRYENKKERVQQKAQTRYRNLSEEAKYIKTKGIREKLWVNKKERKTLTRKTKFSVDVSLREHFIRLILE